MPFEGVFQPKPLLLPKKNPVFILKFVEKIILKVGFFDFLI